MPKQRRCISQDRFGLRYLHLFSFNIFFSSYSCTPQRKTNSMNRQKSTRSIYCVSCSLCCKTNFFCYSYPFLTSFVLMIRTKNELTNPIFPSILPFLCDHSNRILFLFLAQSSQYNSSSCKRTRHG